MRFSSKWWLSGLALMACLTGCGETNAVKDLAQAAGIGGEPRPAPDFVVRTRESHYDYVPVGVSAPKRTKAKDAAGVKSVEAEMDAVRSRNEARGRAARQAGAAAPAAAPPVPPPDMQNEPDEQ